MQRYMHPLQRQIERPNMEIPIRKGNCVAVGGANLNTSNMICCWCLIKCWRTIPYWWIKFQWHTVHCKLIQTIKENLIWILRNFRKHDWGFFLIQNIFNIELLFFTLLKTRMKEILHISACGDSSTNTKKERRKKTKKNWVG